MEAAQGQPVTAPAAQTDRGVQVPGQHVAPFPLARVMTEEKGRVPQGFIDHVDAETGRRVAGVTVVVASHHDHGNTRVACPPGVQRIERVGRTAEAAVQKVAQKHDPLGGSPGNGGVETGEIVFRGAGWHGDAERAETRGLAEVGVGDEQRPARGPRRHTLGHEQEGFSRHLDGKVTPGYPVNGGQLPWVGM